MYSGTEGFVDSVLLDPANLNHILYKTGCLLTYEGIEPTIIGIVHNGKLLPQDFVARICLMCIKNAPKGVTEAMQQCDAITCKTEDTSETSCHLHDIYNEGHVIPDIYVQDN